MESRSAEGPIRREDGNRGEGAAGGEDGLNAERILDQVGHAVIATDLPGNVRYWNQAAETLFGWSAGEVMGRPLTDLTVPNLAQELAIEIMDTVRSGATWSGAFTVRRRDGSTFPALVTERGVYDEAGELAGIVGISIDMAQAMQPLLDRSSDVLLIIGHEETVTLVSPAGLHLFGWTDDTLGRSFWDLIHPEDLEESRLYYRSALGSTGPTGPHECRVICFPEGWCWSEMAVTKLLDEPMGGYAVCGLRDVTARWKEREQLLRLAEQLQTALTTRVVIEQAKGMIAQQNGISVDQAFDKLRQHARSHSARIHDVAEAVVTLGLEI